MSTERFDSDLPVIGSGADTGATIRVDAGIISSALPMGTERLDGGIISADPPRAGGMEANGNIRADDHFLLSGKRYDKKRLIAHSGEADIYEITDGGKSLVLKYY